MSQPAGSRGSPRGKEGFPRREHSSLWLREYKRGCAPFFDNLIEGNFRLVYSVESSPKGSVEDPPLGGTKNSVKNDYLERILRARVYDVAVETPLEVAPNLSARLGNRVLLKREDMQPVFSFKCRGAYNKMANLPARALARGVIASSAGNHAQGVALAAQKLGCGAAIVMPTTTPKIKVDAVKARGAEVHLRGDTYDEAYAEARRLARSRKLAFVHPYDDPDVIAGHGTLAQGGPARRARSRGPVRGRRRGEAGGRNHLSPLPGIARRDDPRGYRPDLRGDQGRVRGHAHDPGAGRCARRRGSEDPCRANRGAREATGRGRLGGEHQLRPPALRRREGGGGRASRSDTRRNHPRAPRELQEILRDARRAQHHRIQLPHRRSEGSARVRRRGGAQPRRDRADRESARARGAEGARPVGGRDGEAARAPHGRRARAGGDPHQRARRARRAALPVRVSRAPRGADELPLEHAHRLEHQPVPLPQSGQRLRPGAGRHAGAGRRGEGLRVVEKFEALRPAAVYAALGHDEIGGDIVRLRMDGAQVSLLVSDPDDLRPLRERRERAVEKSAAVAQAVSISVPSQHGQEHVVRDYFGRIDRIGNSERPPGQFHAWAPLTKDERGFGRHDDRQRRGRPASAQG